jgi:plasmid stabilization system protein ParE
LTKFTVIIQPQAEAEIDEAYLHIAAAASPGTAIRWFNKMEAAIATLARMPRRCPLALEDEFFEEEIRQLLLAPYRVLFTIRERSVHILHVRHMSRRWFGEEDDE